MPILILQLICCQRFPSRPKEKPAFLRRKINPSSFKLVYPRVILLERFQEQNSAHFCAKKEVIMGNTQENLKAAFAGESQANRRYLFFAEAADKEGHKQIARLFRAVAEAETVHARNHLRTLGEIKSTKENLEAAIGGEFYEFTKMYPEFIAQAKAGGNKRAEVTFDYANQVEKIHHTTYTEALKALEGGQTLKDEPYFVCQGCGYTVAGEAPEKCPICQAPRSMFKRIE
jgi:rubrerythrin